MFYSTEMNVVFQISVAITVRIYTCAPEMQWSYHLVITV